jgi:uncharacterized protein (UPF0276 family)
MDSVSNISGVGLRLPHLTEVVATLPPTGWLEVHPENFLANPHAAELLTELSIHYPISFHTVGISVGSVTGIDRLHLKHLQSLIDRIHPILVSGHLAWSTYGNDYLNDLLPIPSNEEALQVVTVHIHQVQDILGRSYLIENPASYVGREFAELEWYVGKVAIAVSGIPVTVEELSSIDAEALPDTVLELQPGLH